MLNLFLPPRCVLCKDTLPSSQQPWICRDCRPKIRSWQGPACSRCREPFERASAAPRRCGRCLQGGSYDRLHTFGIYEAPLAQLIQKFKFGKKLHLGPVLGTFLASHAQRHLSRAHYDCIVPVPIHRQTLARRGFNQAQELARHIHRVLEVAQDIDGLEKIQLTREQARLSRQDREQNLDGVFRSTRSFHGESCLLVDDVFTSGATAETCARTLKAAGALRVDVLTVARTV